MATHNQLSFNTLLMAAAVVLEKPVSLTYSGKPGCACGCRGRYSVHGPAMKVTVNKIREAIMHATPSDDWGLMVRPGEFVAIDNGGCGEATRTYTAYTDGRGL